LDRQRIGGTLTQRNQALKMAERQDRRVDVGESRSPGSESPARSREQGNV
jgi:hypothetical protein